MSRPHHADDFKEFLKDEKAQVWAVHRETGEWFFIERGQAADLREFTREYLKCPVPTCAVTISTRGESRRDHFWHPDGAPHPSDGESEAHLGAKSMLVSWLTTYAERHGGTARKEVTVGSRRADAFFDWTNGDQTAFEVEYKNFMASAWVDKQADYDQHGVPCVWLLGHFRVRTASPAAVPEGGVLAVQVTALPLVQAWAVAQRHVFVINPVTKQIGTLAADKGFTRRLTGDESLFWMRIDDIAECVPDPIAGIRTPSSVLLDEQDAQRRAAEERKRFRLAEERRRQQEAEAAERQRRAEEAAARAEAKAASQRQWDEIEARNTDAWERSKVRRVATARWRQIPDLLSKEGFKPWGIHALPVHWHCVVYEAFVHPEGPDFTIEDCYAEFARQGIDVNWDRKKRFQSLIRFLETLECAGLIQRNGQYRWRVLHSIDTLAQQAADRERQRQQEIADRRTSEAAARAAAERDRARLRAERQAHAKEVVARQQQRWAASPFRLACTDEDGNLLRCIAWSGGDFTEAIDTLPEEWRAHVCLEFLDGQPAGVPVTVLSAVDALVAADIPFVGSMDAVREAVAEYLYNLRQRGLLRAVEESGGYVTTGAPLA